MPPQRWVTTLLRARTAKEDQAKQRLGAARREEQLALAHAAAERRRATATGKTEGPLSTAAFLAVAAARSAAAATADQAHQVAQDAGAVANQTLLQLVEAARGRRTAEELLERQSAVIRAREKSAEERDMDEIAARPRASADGFDAPTPPEGGIA